VLTPFNFTIALSPLGPAGPSGPLILLITFHSFNEFLYFKLAIFYTSYFNMPTTFKVDPSSPKPAFQSKSAPL
jgi:hypothetical protein